MLRHSQKLWLGALESWDQGDKLFKDEFFGKSAIKFSEANIILNNLDKLAKDLVLENLKKGTVYLQKIKDSSLINLDSIVVDGQDIFTLSTIVETPELFYLYVDKVDGTEYNDRVTFFGEKGDIKLNTHLDKINYKVNITGSKNHKIYTKYQNSLKNIRGICWF